MKYKMKDKMKYNFLIYSSLFSIIFMFFTVTCFVGAGIIWLITGEMISRGSFFNLSLGLTTILFMFVLISSLLQKKPE